MGNAKRIARRIVAEDTDARRIMAIIPDDGYADGGEPYTGEEMDVIERGRGAATVSVGDEITNPGGVDATDIPVGAIVQYATGVDQKDGEYEVVLIEGRKMLGLGFPDTPLWTGHNGPMTVLSLPEDITADSLNRYRVNDEMGAGLSHVADRVVSALQAAGHEAWMDDRELVTSGSRSDVISAAGAMGDTFLSSRM